MQESVRMGAWGPAWGWVLAWLFVLFVQVLLGSCAVMRGGARRRSVSPAAPPSSASNQLIKHLLKQQLILVRMSMILLCVSLLFCPLNLWVPVSFLFSSWLSFSCLASRCFLWKIYLHSHRWWRFLSVLLSSSTVWHLMFVPHLLLLDDLSLLLDSASLNAALLLSNRKTYVV